ncbi:hypothetical protein ACIQU6_17330 [Streptomyces sp. NPDC090442]|uniref:hypothetical protein n=1 Tax=Streptomyces sp. NPDC090442 TaxID=3365962 RepID=UPI00382453CB
MSAQTQLKVIDAVAELGGDQRIVTSKEVVARRVGLEPATVGAPGFLEQAGLAEPGRGVWRLTEVGLRFARLRTSDSARSRLLLRDHWQGQWFQQAAVRVLVDGPLEERDFAGRLCRGVRGTQERRLTLVDWLNHGLIVHREADGLITLAPRDGSSRGAGASSADRARTQASGTHTIADPLLAMPAEKITALPLQQFRSFMNAYGAVYQALTPTPAPAG